MGKPAAAERWRSIGVVLILDGAPLRSVPECTPRPIVSYSSLYAPLTNKSKVAKLGIATNADHD